MIDAATWAALKPALANAALVRLEEIPGVTVPYVHFHPTLAPFLARDLPAEPRAALETRYWQAYYQFARDLVQSDRKAPHQARALAARELPNLKAGLRLALAAGALDEAVVFADRINWFLDVFGRWRERDEVMGWVEKEMGKEGKEERESSRSGNARMHGSALFVYSRCDSIRGWHLSRCSSAPDFTTICELSQSRDRARCNSMGSHVLPTACPLPEQPARTTSTRLPEW